MTGKKIRSRMAAVVLAGLAMFFFTACGGQYDEANQGASGGAVSGQAVTGESVSGEAVDVRKENGQVFYTTMNSTNYYLQSDVGILQCTLDGKVIKELDLGDDFIGLFAATDEGVYYVEWGRDPVKEKKYGDGELYHELWRLPIRKGKDGMDILEQDKKELILEDPEITEFQGAYVDKNYICCVVGAEDRELIKYDRRAGKIVSRIDFQKKKGADTSIELLGNCRGNILLAVDTEAVGAEQEWAEWPKRTFYCQKADGDKWKKIGLGGEQTAVSYLITENYFYYTHLEKGMLEVLRYDPVSGKTAQVASKEKINTALEEGGISPGSKGNFDISEGYGLYYYEGELYLQIGLGEGEEGSPKDYVLIRIPLMKEEDPVLDKQITEKLSASVVIEAIYNGAVVTWDGSEEECDKVYDLAGKTWKKIEDEGREAQFPSLVNDKHIYDFPY